MDASAVERAGFTSFRKIDSECIGSEARDRHVDPEQAAGHVT